LRAKQLIIEIMKKVIFSVAVVLFVMASCGGPSACDCVKQFEELDKKADEAKSEEDLEKILDEMEKLEEKCKQFKDEDFDKCGEK
jgi:hypothetical protein